MRLPTSFPTEGLRLTGFAFQEPGQPDYVFYLELGVHDWLVRSYGMPEKRSARVVFRTEVLLGQKNVYSRKYTTHDETMKGHTALVVLCTLAESQEELLSLIQMAGSNVPGSSATEKEREADR